MLGVNTVPCFNPLLPDGGSIHHFRMLQTHYICIYIYVVVLFLFFNFTCNVVCYVILINFKGNFRLTVKNDNSVNNRYAFIHS